MLTAPCRQEAQERRVAAHFSKRLLAERTVVLACLAYCMLRDSPAVAVTSLEAVWYLVEALAAQLLVGL